MPRVSAERPSRRTSCIAAMLVAGAAIAAHAQEIPGFEDRTFAGRHGETMPYRLFVPEGYDPHRSYPLVLWLHGAAGRGRDNMAHVAGASAPALAALTSPASQSEHPAFVVAPQCPPQQEWASQDGSPSAALHFALELVERLEEAYSIDDTRIYVAGQNMGGDGTWTLVAARPYLFAAAVPLSGGGDVSLAASLRGIGVWAFHAENDPVASVQRSRTMIDALRGAGASPRYTEYPGPDHPVALEAFAEPELLTWLFAQRRVR